MDHVFIMERVICFVDGLNLFFPVKALGKQSLKWLNLNILAGEWVQTHNKMVGIRYYNAPPVGNKRGSHRLENYRAYMRLLENDGITVKHGRHKIKEATLLAKAGTMVPVIVGGKQRKAKLARDTLIKGKVREEKMTDVNIAIDLVGLASRNEYDRAILISSDIDLTPAVEEVATNHNKKVTVALTNTISSVSNTRSVTSFHGFASKMEKRNVNIELLQISKEEIVRASYPKVVKISDKLFTRPKDWD